MRIWLISDTHNQHDRLEVPNVDVVIHCGDESTHGSPYWNEPEARSFFEWYAALDIPAKIFVPGNHSTAIEQGLIRPEDFPTIEFLIHQATECRGLRIFGSPYTPEFFHWAYMRPRAEMDAVWQTVPSDVDILITHGPPRGIRDVTRDLESGRPIHVGCAALARHVAERIRPKLHAFGHIHDEPGIEIGRAHV